MGESDDRQEGGDVVVRFHGVDGGVTMSHDLTMLKIPNTWGGMMQGWGGGKGNIQKYLDVSNDKYHDLQPQSVLYLSTLVHTIHPNIYTQL